MRFSLRLFYILIVPVLLILFSCDLSAETPAKDVPAKSDESAPKSWEFDPALYTNHPKTGQRTWQYEKGRSAYHDPNAWFDSPHMGYPFNGNWTLQPYDVFPYPYYPGPDAEHPTYAPDPRRPEQSVEE